MLLKEPIQRILAEFANNYILKIHGRALAKKLDMNQKTIANTLNLLEKQGFLTYVREGKNKLYAFNRGNPSLYQLLMLAETYKALYFLSSQPQLAFLLKDASEGAIIFGSHAKSLARRDSDIDLVLFKKKKSLEHQLKNASVKFHIQYTTLKDFQKKLQRKNTLAIEIAHHHIILSKFDDLIKLFMEFYYE